MVQVEQNQNRIFGGRFSDAMHKAGVEVRVNTQPFSKRESFKYL